MPGHGNESAAGAAAPRRCSFLSPNQSRIRPAGRTNVARDFSPREGLPEFLAARRANELLLTQVELQPRDGRQIRGLGLIQRLKPLAAVVRPPGEEACATQQV